MLHYVVYLPTSFWVKLLTSLLAIQLADLLPKVFIVFVEKGNVHDISLRLLGLVVISWGIPTLHLGVSLSERFFLGRALYLLLVIE